MTEQTSAVTVIEQPAEAGVVEWNLDSFPEGQFNRLIPTQTLQMPTDLFRPVVQVVSADPPDGEGKSPDSYKSNDVPNGHRAPTARLLNKLATAAAVSFLEERRIDDGTDPDVIGVSVLASMVLPTGQRITAPGSQLINLKTWFSDRTTPAEAAKFRKQFYAHVSTRAKNRAIRGLLSLRSSYPERDLAKPFAVVSYVPNMNHPEVRARVLDAIAPVTAQLYGGPSGQAKQLTAGPGELRVPEAPDEDPAPAPTALPGESIAKAKASSVPEEPDWMQPPAKAEAPADLATRIRDTAAAAEDPDAKATSSELATLREIFTGWDGKLVGAGIRALWDGQAPNDLGSGQAKAIATVHDSLGHERFEREWRTLAEKAAVAA